MDMLCKFVNNDCDLCGVWFKLLMEHMTTGTWHIRPQKGKVITMRRILDTKDSYSEQDLLDLDA